MEHIKKYWAFYLGIILLIIVGIQLKWFGNTKTLFRFGGAIPSAPVPSPTPAPHPIPSPTVRSIPVINLVDRCTDAYNRCIASGGSVIDCTKLKNACSGQTNLTAACYLAIHGDATWGSTLYDLQWKKCFNSIK